MKKVASFLQFILLNREARAILRVKLETLGHEESQTTVEK
jgi:hypothetical protein